MRDGLTPLQSTQAALRRIIPHYRNFVGAIVAARVDGTYGAACYGMQFFQFSVYTLSNGLILDQVQCITM